MEYLHRMSTPLGGILLSSDGEALTGLWFEGQKHFGANLFPSSSRVIAWSGPTAPWWGMPAAWVGRKASSAGRASGFSQTAMRR